MTRDHLHDLCRAADCLTMHVRTARLSPEGLAAARLRLTYLLECLAASAAGPDDRGLVGRVTANARGVLNG